MVLEPQVIGRGPVPVLERKQIIRKGAGTQRQGLSHWGYLCRLCRWAPRSSVVTCEGTVSYGLSLNSEVCPLGQMFTAGQGPIPWGPGVGWGTPGELGEQFWEPGVRRDGGGSRAHSVGAGACREGCVQCMGIRGPARKAGEDGRVLSPAFMKA